MPIGEDKLEMLRERCDLVSLAQEAGARFRKMGQSLRSPCPLHGGDNRTAFAIFEEGGRQVWRCWTGCRSPAAGDVITFVEAWRRCDFLEAVRFLAERAGFSADELWTPAEAQEQRARDEMSRLLGVCAQFYRQEFSASAAARRYAQARGFSAGTAERAGFGYSNGRGLDRWLAQAGASLELARRVGVLRADGRDFTANAAGDAASPPGWLIYVHQVYARTVYLSARALAPADPKNKSRNLPGSALRREMYRAEAGTRAVVLVEGPADAESWRQLGHSAWALCGAAVSSGADTLRGLRARVPVYLNLDNDAVGRHSVADIAQALGPLTMVLPALPGEAKDANDWLRRGPAAADVAQVLAAARPWIDIALEQARAAPVYALADHAERLLDLLAELPEVLRGRYLRRLECELEIPREEGARLLRSRLGA